MTGEKVHGVCAKNSVSGGSAKVLHETLNAS
jgi:hypothetical protein